MSTSPRPVGACTIGARVEVVDTPPTGHRAAREVTAQSRARQAAQLRMLVALAERQGRDATVLRRRLDEITGNSGPQIAQDGRTGSPAGDGMGTAQ